MSSYVQLCPILLGDKLGDTVSPWLSPCVSPPMHRGLLPHHDHPGNRERGLLGSYSWRSGIRLCVPCWETSGMPLLRPGAWRKQTGARLPLRQHLLGSQSTHRRDRHDGPVLRVDISTISQNSANSCLKRKKAGVATGFPAPIKETVSMCLWRQSWLGANPAPRFRPSRPGCCPALPVSGTHRPLPGGLCARASTRPAPSPDASIASSSRYSSQVRSIAMPQGLIGPRVETEYPTGTTKQQYPASADSTGRQKIADARYLPANTAQKQFLFCDT